MEEEYRRRRLTVYSDVYKEFEIARKTFARSINVEPKKLSANYFLRELLNRYKWTQKYYEVETNERKDENRS